LIAGRRDESVKSNNYFHYDEAAVEKLEFISDAKSVGFTIKEIGQIIDAWYNRKYSKKEKLQILDEKLLSLERKMKEIREMKKQIMQFKDDVVNNRC
jgi:DNA-binding transcriptional MerR regulator